MEFEVENLQSAKIEVYDYSKKGICTFSEKGYGCNEHERLSNIILEHKLK